MDYEYLESILRSKGDLEALIKNEIEKNSEIKCVLGIDIYRYSKMNRIQQFLIPHFIEKILKKTFKTLELYESIFFSREDLKEIKDTKIDTGDGFLVFIDDPVKSIIFLGVFTYIIQIERRKNIQLSTLLGELDIRQTLTMGEVYKYNGKFYGEAIIKCSRILSLDNLNRFLIDSNTYNWFYINGEGIDSFRLHSLDGLKKYRNLKLYLGDERESRIYINNKPPIRTFISQKIGKLKSKNDTVDIYNIFSQTDTNTETTSPYDPPNYVISIGNLHTGGI